MYLDAKINHSDVLSRIVGIQDRNLNVFKQYLDIRISIHEEKIFTDAPVEMKPLLELIFSCLIDLAENEVNINERDMMYIINSAQKGKTDYILSLYKNQKRILVTDQGKSVYPKTLNQSYYVQAMANHDLTFGVGPAGTGKTYLAVAHAVNQLKQNKVKKLILTRPAVEAGETLGFLPGDLKEKVDPYLIPLYDALYEMLGKAQTDLMLEKGIIEIAPLAYMRGRTLENAFVILDEAQNTTKAQMKMFLTRLGFSSQMVITGDPSQVDLPKGQISGLKVALELLEDMNDIKIIYFDKIDVIRHPLVQRILERYENEG